jgi:hypothetical protein
MSADPVHGTTTLLMDHEPWQWHRSGHGWAALLHWRSAFWLKDWIKRRFLQEYQRRQQEGVMNALNSRSHHHAIKDPFHVELPPSAC